MVVVDNTFATPLTQTPLALGADVVVHSATKMMGGHSDLLAGVAVSAQEAQVQALRQHRTLYGATPGALEMFLALRGLRTMPLRFERAQTSARALVGFLRAHPMISLVRYPGFGAVISFELHGDAEQAERVAASLQIIVHATSLGGVESTIERRAKLAGQSHVPPSLLRLSVGIEDAADLQRDLTEALEAGR
jgi:cystathionine gamma-synthase